MKPALVIYICMICVILYANNKIPIPDSAAVYDEKDIITDPETGDKIITNQLVMIFDQEVSFNQQKNILKSFSGKIAGGIPDMNVYHIQVNNASSISNIKSLCRSLEKNRYVLYASPRIITKSKVKKMKINGDNTIERKGSLNLEVENQSKNGTESKGVNKIQDILIANRGELIGCVKRKYNLSASYHGTILFRIAIMKTGEVSQVDILKSSVKDKIITNCLKNKIRKWKNFPKHSKKTNMQIDFTFKF